MMRKKLHYWLSWKIRLTHPTIVIVIHVVMVVIVVTEPVCCRAAAIVTVVHATIGCLGVVEKTFQVVSCVDRCCNSTCFQVQ